MTTTVRPKLRPDGVPTRIDMSWMSPAELAILEAMRSVEMAGASFQLTAAIALLQQARDRVADHVEGVVFETAVPTADQRSANAKKTVGSADVLRG